MMITQERLKQLLLYEQETGIFRWIARASNNTHIGAVAGSVNGAGYWTIRIDGKLQYAHRLAFLYMTGSCPKYVDHRDTCRSNNEWGNLREATKAQNEWNTGLRRCNTSGAKNVFWSKRLSKWTVSIRFNGANRYLGCFESKDRAIEFRQLAAEMLHGEFARHA